MTWSLRPLILPQIRQAELNLEVRKILQLGKNIEITEKCPTHLYISLQFVV